MIQIKKILVPTDFSEYAQLALQYGISLCREFEAKLILLHVIEDPFYPSTGANFGFDMADFFDRLEKESEQRMVEMTAEIEAQQFSVERIITRGTPFMEIIRIAREETIDMIILSTHGRTGLAHVLMGGVTDKVVRKAPCPVLVVRKAQHDFIMP